MTSSQLGADKCLILTVGLPRSGKSTWSLSINKKYGYPIVNPDSVRLALHGNKFIGEAEPMVWVIARYIVKSLFLAGHDHVILDSTIMKRKRRDEWRSIHWVCRFHQIMTDRNNCIQRALSRHDMEIIPVIDRMCFKFEPLGADEIRLVV